MVPNSFPLTPAEQTAYEEQGFVVLQGIVGAAVLAELRDVFADVVDRLARHWCDEGFVQDTCDELSFERRYAALRAQLPPRFPTSWRRALVSRPVYDLWQRPELLGRARSIVGDEVFAHGTWNGRPREPGTEIQRIEWHQDAHYYKDWDPADGKLVTMWIPLVPVDEQSGCLELANRSHESGCVDRISSANGLFTVPEGVVDGYTTTTAVMDPGDALIFSDLTLHRALENRSPFVRWSIDIRFGSATAPIMAKSPPGYRCFSADEPSSVEGYEQWSARFAPLQLDGDVRVSGALDDLARRIGTSRSELEVF